MTTSAAASTSDSPLASPQHKKQKKALEEREEEVDNKMTNHQKDDAAYIPAHLRTYVFHSQDDFYVSRYFDPLLLCHLMYEGFLPIASEYHGQCFLLPKLHRQRCVLLLHDGPPHVPKSVKKRSKKYKLVLNQAFDQVVDGCHEQHGIPWLYPPIVKSFKHLYEAGKEGIEIYPDRKVRFWTVELVDAETNALCAGELGYTIGKVYTSLTGFSRVNGAGTVQLHALGWLLYLCGMQVWDLGMSMPYKMSLGAQDLDRDVFLEHLHRGRTEECVLALPSATNDSQGVHVKDLLEMTRQEEAKADEHQDDTKQQEPKTKGNDESRREHVEKTDAAPS